MTLALRLDAPVTVQLGDRFLYSTGNGQPSRGYRVGPDGIFRRERVRHMATRKRTTTVAAGAVIERALVQRYLTRLARSCHRATGGEVISEIKQWLRQQPKRTARKGGIGR